MITREEKQSTWTVVMITRTVAVRKMSNMAFAVGFFFLH
jgi:hypothetical protein